MDFTRDPIVETVITSKEDYKLLIRSCGRGEKKEYIVDVVEVVAFGKCYFLRSREHSPAFLLPMTEYDVIEEKEVRSVLKKAVVEKSIKIGGGKKAPKKTAAKKKVDNGESLIEQPSNDLLVDSSKETPNGAPKKKNTQKKSKTTHQKISVVKTSNQEEKPAKERAKRPLLPPPPTLISSQIDRYKKYRVEEDKDLDSPSVDQDAETLDNNAGENKIVDLQSDIDVDSDTTDIDS